MLKEYTLIAHHGGEYNAQTVGKEYVVNMMNNRRTLHSNSRGQICGKLSGSDPMKSNNTKLLNKEEIKTKMMELTYIQERLAEE